MMGTIAFLLIALLIVFVILAAAKPAEFQIERSIAIAAPAATVHELIATLRNWERWNPNGMNDASVQRTYGAAAGGVGATATWAGKRAGAGHMEISAAAPDEIVVTVEFEKPFKARNVNTFRLRADGAATSVSWAMHGPKPLPARIMGLVLNMDRMMGRHFETGLAELKACAEG